MAVYKKHTVHIQLVSDHKRKTTETETFQKYLEDYH